MAKVDPFTQRRAVKFVEEFRASTGQLPTLQDLEKTHLTKDVVELLIKDQVLEEFYVTLQSGTVVKGYKIKVF